LRSKKADEILKKSKAFFNDLSSQWSRAESNCCPNWVLTIHSFTGLVFLTLKLGSSIIPDDMDSLIKS